MRLTHIILTVMLITAAHARECYEEEVRFPIMIQNMVWKGETQVHAMATVKIANKQFGFVAGYMNQIAPGVIPDPLTYENYPGAKHFSTYEDEETMFFALVDLKYHNYMYFFHFKDWELYKSALAVVEVVPGQTVALIVSGQKPGYAAGVWTQFSDFTVFWINVKLGKIEAAVKVTPGTDFFVSASNVSVVNGKIYVSIRKHQGCDSTVATDDLMIVKVGSPADVSFHKLDGGMKGQLWALASHGGSPDVLYAGGVDCDACRAFIAQYKVVVGGGLELITIEYQGHFAPLTSSDQCPVVSQLYVTVSVSSIGDYLIGSTQSTEDALITAPVQAGMWTQIILQPLITTGTDIGDLAFTTDKKAIRLQIEGTSTIVSTGLKILVSGLSSYIDDVNNPEIHGILWDAQLGYSYYMRISFLLAANIVFQFDQMDMQIKYQFGAIEGSNPTETDTIGLSSQFGRLFYIYGTADTDKYAGASPSFDFNTGYIEATWNSYRCLTPTIGTIRMVADTGFTTFVIPGACFVSGTGVTSTICYTQANSAIQSTSLLSQPQTIPDYRPMQLDFLIKPNIFGNAGLCTTNANWPNPDHEIVPVIDQSYTIVFPYYPQAGGFASSFRLPQYLLDTFQDTCDESPYEVGFITAWFQPTEIIPDSNSMEYGSQSDYTNIGFFNNFDRTFVFDTQNIQFRGYNFYMQPRLYLPNGKAQNIQPTIRLRLQSECMDAEIKDSFSSSVDYVIGSDDPTTQFLTPDNPSASLLKPTSPAFCDLDNDSILHIDMQVEVGSLETTHPESWNVVSQIVVTLTKYVSDNFGVMRSVDYNVVDKINFEKFTITFGGDFSTGFFFEWTCENDQSLAGQTLVVTKCITVLTGQSCYTLFVNLKGDGTSSTTFGGYTVAFEKELDEIIDLDVTTVSDLSAWSYQLPDIVVTENAGRRLQASEFYVDMIIPQTASQFLAYTRDDRTIVISDPSLVVNDNYFLMVRIAAESSASDPTSTAFDPSSDIIVLNIGGSYFGDDTDSTVAASTDLPQDDGDTVAAQEEEIQEATVTLNEEQIEIEALTDMYEIQEIPTEFKAPQKKHIHKHLRGIPPQIKRAKCTYSGALTVEFTKTMKFNKEILRRIEESKLEDERTEVYQAFLEIQFIPQNSEIKQEFYWNITGFGPDRLEIQLTFSNASEIGREYSPDQVLLLFNPGKLLFYDLEWLQLEPNTEITVDLPTIVSGATLAVVEATKQGSAVIKDFTNLVASVNFGVAFLAAITLTQYWSLCNIMQIFVLLSLFNVSLTAPLGVFFGYLTSIALFEIFPTQLPLKWITGILTFLPKAEDKNVFDLAFSFEREQPYNDRFSKMQFDNESFSKIMGFTLIVLFGIVIQFLWLLVLYLGPQTHWVRAKYAAAKKSLFWSTPILFFYECYVDLVLACVLQLDNPSAWELSGDKFDYVLAYGFAGPIILFPFFVGWFLFRNAQQISKVGSDDEYLAKYEVLFAEKNLSKPHGFTFFPLIFLTRRILLITLVLCDPKYTSIYLMIVVYVHLAYITWLQWNHPFEKKLDNTIEVFNESLGLYLLYFMRLLSDRAASEETRNAISYWMIGLALCILVLNVGLITVGLVQELLLRSKRKRQQKTLQKKIELRDNAKALQLKQQLDEESQLPDEIVHSFLDGSRVGPEHRRKRVTKQNVNGEQRIQRAKQRLADVTKELAQIEEIDEVEELPGE